MKKLKIFENNDKAKEFADVFSKCTSKEDLLNLKGKLTTFGFEQGELIKKRNLISKALKSFE